MGSLLSVLSEHGYALLFGSLFLEAIGLPIPAALALLIAGAASSRGALRVPLAVGGAVVATVAGDTVMFLLGRYTGWWLLGLLCRISLNPESCILRSADSFYRRGRTLLVIAKFIPGINTMAPPLAGSMNMRAAQFLQLDLAGALLYTGAYFGLGFAFGGAIDAVTHTYEAFSRLVGTAIVALLIGYAAWQVALWIKARSEHRTVPLVSPSEAARACASDGAVIYDVRSHGYYDQKATRIRGSRRLEPHALGRCTDDLPGDKPISVYCSCVREATSARVARTLMDRGVRPAVIKGGLRAWKKAGLPMEPVPGDDVTALPMFDS